jgi:uncharacterized membrane protein YeaQ/YmgE (transglycosylase-associated protein family)
MVLLSGRRSPPGWRVSPAGPRVGIEGVPEAAANAVRQRRCSVKNLRPTIGLFALTLVAQKGKVRIDLGSILLYALIGLVVGILARFLVPGRDPMGFIGTLVIGVVGAVLGGWLAGAVFPETQGVDWLASILVAILLVLLVRSFRGGTRRTF